MPNVLYERRGPTAVVTIDRPDVRNAVDQQTATELREAFVRVEGEDDIAAAVLTGTGGTFCAGADLKAASTGRGNRVSLDDLARNGQPQPDAAGMHARLVYLVETFEHPR